MSTSDQQEHGALTRKQLREIRLTGSTPVISAEEAAAAAAPVVPPAPPVPPLPRAAEPVAIAPTPASAPASDDADTPLTRRQIREQERIKTASVPVIGGEDAVTDAIAPAPVEPAPAPVEPAPAPVEPAPVVFEPAPVVFEPAPAVVEPEPAPVQDEIVSGIPSFATPAAPAPAEEHEDDDIDEQVDVAPVSAAAAVGDVPVLEEAVDVKVEVNHDDEDPVAAVAALGIEVEDEPDEDDVDDENDVLSDVRGGEDVEIAEGDRPVVSSTFGQGVLADAAAASSAEPSFDELLSESTSGSHSASNTLIFNPPAGEGALDGPVASTGEILVTGSYELPKGLGSQGHAHGVADGKDVDAVLIDGELPPASSPTPIAASSAVSTIKPAGEVIRPPAPEKGNKLMLTLAIVAGGLALALGVVLVIAFTTGMI